jgi:hypothetical protein
MADRGLSAAAITALSSRAVEFYSLVRIDLSTPLYFTTAPYDIVFDGKTFLSGIISKIPVITESLKIKPSTLNLKLSGASLLVHALGFASYKNKEVYIYQHILNVSGGTETVLTFKGYIDSFTSTENADKGTSSFSFDVASHWNDWESTSGRLLTTENQEDLFSGDVGLEFVGVTEPVVGYWGKHDFQRIDTFVQNRRDIYSAVPGYYELHIEPIYDLFGYPDSIAGAIGEFDLKALNGSASKLPIVYGLSPVVGTPIFRDTSGTNGEFLWVVYTLAEGECDSISDITFDGVSYNDASISGKISFNFYSGTDTQTADGALVAAAGSWTTNHRLRGICYVIIKYTYDTQVWSGEPQPKFILKGKKCAPIGGGTASFTTDPARILQDYLTNSTYGKGLALSDLDAFSAGSTYCTSPETQHNGGAGTIARFAFNGVLSTSVSIKKNAEAILYSMIGHLPWIAGKYKLVIERDDETSTFLFDEDTITGAFTVKDVGIKQRANEVYYSYKNVLIDYSEASEFTKLSSGVITSEDNGRAIRKNVTNKYETDKYRAKNRSNTILKVSRNGITVGLKSANSKVLQIETGVVVSITRASQAWTAKLFRVFDIKMNQGGRFDFALREYDATNYDWAVSAEKSEPVPPTLTDPLTVSPPTILVMSSAAPNHITTDDGTSKGRIKLSFTAPTKEHEVAGYQVEYKTSPDTDYTRLADLIGRTSTITYIDNVTQDVTYNIRIYAVNTLGVRSSALLGTHTITAATKIGYNGQFRGIQSYGTDGGYTYTNQWNTLDDVGSPNASLINGQVNITGNAGTAGGALKVAVPIFGAIADFSQEMRFKASFRINGASNLGSGEYAYISMGAVVGFDHFGFRLEWNSGTSMIDVYGIQDNGTIETIFVKAIANNTEATLECKFNYSDGDIDFTVDSTTVTLTPSAILDTELYFDVVMHLFLSSGTAGAEFFVGEYFAVVDP